MIRIHHLLDSQSERIIWLMEELELPYDLVSYPRDPATSMAPPALRELHPLGQAPIIEDGEIVLAESLAITLYILEKFGGGRLRVAQDAAGHADYLYWLCYSVGGLMPQAMLHMAAARMGEDDSPRGLVMRERKQRHFDMIEARLSTNEWLAGSAFTAADIMCHFPFGTMSKFAPLDLTPYPGICAWVNRISKRAAYQRAIRAAGHDSDPAQLAR